MAQRITRPTNATAHPGLIDRNAPRRTKEDLQAERQAKVMAKAQMATERKASIDRIAGLETAERQKVVDMDRQANDPKSPPTQSKVRTSRKRPVDEDIGQRGFQRSEKAYLRIFIGPAETPTRKQKRANVARDPMDHTSSQ